MQALSKALVYSLAFISGIQSLSSEGRQLELVKIGSGNFDIGSPKDLDLSIDAAGFFVTVVETSDSTISFPYDVKCSDSSKKVDDLFEFQVTKGDKATVRIKVKPIHVVNVVFSQSIIAKLNVPKGTTFGTVNLTADAGSLTFTNQVAPMDTLNTTVDAGTIVAQVS